MHALPSKHSKSWHFFLSILKPRNTFAPRTRPDEVSPVDPEVLERRKAEWLGLAPEPRCARASVGDANTPKAFLAPKSSKGLWARWMFAAKDLVSNLRDGNEDDSFNPWPISVLGLDKNEEQPKATREHSKAEGYEPELLKEQLRMLRQPWITGSHARESISWLGGSVHTGTVRAWGWSRKQSRFGRRICFCLASGVWAGVRALSPAGVHHDSGNETDGEITSFAAVTERRERRAAPRHKVNLPSRIFLAHAALWEPAVTKDISVHGVFLYTEHADHPVGSIVNILMSEQQDEKIRRVRYRARIVRMERNAERPTGFAAAILGCEHLGTPAV